MCFPHSCCCTALPQKKKKLRKKDTAEELAFLEEEAAAAGGNAADHGSRGARATLAETRTAERDQAAALKQQRCGPVRALVCMGYSAAWCNDPMRCLQVRPQCNITY